MNPDELIINHEFSPSVAKKTGVIPAILYNYIKTEVFNNSIHNINQFDGKYWIGQSIAAMCNVFPYLTAPQIRYGINKLVENKYIERRQHNKSRMDHTNWYTLI